MCDANLDDITGTSYMVEQVRKFPIQRLHIKSLSHAEALRLNRLLLSDINEIWNVSTDAANGPQNRFCGT